MAKLSSNFIPSRSLLVSNQALAIISKRFETNGIDVLSKEMDKTMRLKFRFKVDEEKLEQQMEKLKLRQNELKRSRPLDDIAPKVIRNVMRVEKAEADVKGRIFLLTIAQDRVSIETSGRVSQIRLFFVQTCFEFAIYLVRQAYKKMKWNVFFTQKR